MEPSATLKLVLAQPEHGWLPLSVTVGDEVFEYKASNVMNDTLAEIAEVALALDDGGPVNDCVRIWEEPATKELQFEAHGDSLSVHFSIYDADRRERIVSAMIERGTARDALVNALLSLETMSRDGHLDGWGPFPASALRLLAADATHLNIDNVLSKLRGSPRVRSGSGVGEEEIANAERTLGFALPASVRRYLRVVGWLSVDSHDLFGLGSGIAPYLDLVTMTRSERKDVEPALPHALLPLENDGFGNHYCVDTRSPAATVVFFSHERPRDQELEVVAPTFEAWLLELLDEQDD